MAGVDPSLLTVAQGFADDLADLLHRTEFGVEAKDGWAGRIRAGRLRWRRMQVKAAIRDVVKDDPDAAPEELRQAVDAAQVAVTESEH